MLRTHTCSELNEKDIGKSVKLCGWVDTIREHGKITFVDLKDRYGKVQSVAIAKNKEAFEILKGLTKESSIMVEGKVQQRPKGTENEKIPTGKIEVFIEKVGIFNRCPPLPFELEDKNVNEDVRLKYRFIDLRRPEMQRNLVFRDNVIKSARDFFHSKNFIEIETPLIAKSTPEGSRDYVIPSRVHAGKFYALPQSPQLFKQLMMVAGYDRYFQIARCMRDEDLRADRQPEFTQIDIEMSFIEQDDIIKTTEEMLKKVFKETLNVDLKIPFKRISYQDAMKKYKSDKPDLRKETKEKFAFVWVIDFPLFEYSEEEKKHVSTHHPFTMPNMDEFKKNPLKSNSLAYDIVLNGVELGGGSIRIHDLEIQKKIFDILGISPAESEKKFGFLLNALGYGAPPHGGLAIGLDRMIQLMLELESIREAIAFPKNKEARDVMLDAPSEISDRQLKESHINLSLGDKVYAPKKENVKKVSKKKK
jgi:aspartyl-tRNA synthetase